MLPSVVDLRGLCEELSHPRTCLIGPFFTRGLCPTCFELTGTGGFFLFVSHVRDETTSVRFVVLFRLTILLCVFLLSPFQWLLLLLSVLSVVFFRSHLITYKALLVSQRIYDKYSWRLRRPRLIAGSPFLLFSFILLLLFILLFSLF